MKKRHVTLELIRKRSEHNECLVSTLEEIALHQEELEAIGPILGRTCGKTLKILLLQNNVISRMDPGHLRTFRSLEYLNLALNNIRTVEGIEHMEFLNKLDLTLNFIGVHSLEKSLDAMARLRSLTELYLTGNPCVAPDLPSKSNTGWSGTRLYVIARLPQLQTLDGKPILRSERILANQRLPHLQADLLSILSREVSHTHEPLAGTDAVIGEEELTQHTPETRAKISNEMAQQKAEKEKNERANQPKLRGEKEFEQEQNASIHRARQREERGDIRQCNEGKWKFQFDEEKRPGCILLDIFLPKHLSSSLIDVDVHPTYVSVVIKSKVLRLLLPAEVRSEESTARRSTTTGNLLVIMPKCNQDKSVLNYSGMTGEEKHRNGVSEKKGVGTSKDDRKERKGLASDLLRDATQHSMKGPVRIDCIVKSGHRDEVEERAPSLDMKQVTSRKKMQSPLDVDDESKDQVQCTTESKICNLVCSDDDSDDSTCSADDPPPLM